MHSEHIRLIVLPVLDVVTANDTKFSLTLVFLPSQEVCLLQQLLLVVLQLSHRHISVFRWKS